MDGNAFFATQLAALSSRGGTIALAPEVYTFTENLTIDRPCISISGTKGYGGAAGGTVLSFPPNKGIVLQNADAFFASGIRIMEAGSISSVGQLLCVDGDTYGATFQDVEFVGGYRNLWLKKSAISRFLRCRFVSAYGMEAINICDGPEATHGVDAAEFMQCILSASPTTNVVNMNGKAHSVKMTQCAVLFGKTGIKMTNSVASSSGPKFFYFSDGGFENGTGYCVFCESADDVKFSNAYFSNDGLTSDGIYMSANMTGNVSVMGCKIRGCGRSGIRFLGGRLTAVGNDIINNKSTGIYVASGLSTAQIAQNFIANNVV